MNSTSKQKWITFGLSSLVLVIAVIIFFNVFQKETQIKQISLRLLWLNQSQFAGVYAAAEKGFYQDENLAVTVIPGGPGVNPIKMVASGSEDIGICLGSDIILARAKGIPVRSLAIMVKENPTTYFAKTDSGIKSVQDFRGKKIGVKVGFPVEYYLTAMMRNAGVGESEIERVPVQFNMARFFNDEIEVWSGLRINEPNVVRSKGFEVNEILPSDYGVDVVGEVIFTSEDFFSKNKEACWAFVRATWKGWKFAEENKEKAILYVMKYNEKGNKDHETAMLGSILPLIFENRGVNPFDQDVATWQRMIDFLTTSKVLNKPVSASECFWKNE